MSATAVFLLFFIAFISFSDHSSLTGAAMQNIAFMTAGSQFSAGVREIPGVDQYTIELTRTVKNGQIIVTENPAIAFTQPFYSKFTISSDNAARMGAVQLFLKLEEQLLLSKGISKVDVQIFRNGEGVETIFTKQEGRYFSYTATAPGIGDFVIGKAALTMEEVTAEPATLEEAAVPEEQAPAMITTSLPTEEEALLVRQAAAEPEAETGFWSSIRRFFERLFG